MNFKNAVYGHTDGAEELKTDWRASSELRLWVRRGTLRLVKGQLPHTHTEEQRQWGRQAVKDWLMGIWLLEDKLLKTGCTSAMHSALTAPHTQPRATLPITRVSLQNIQISMATVSIKKWGHLSETTPSSKSTLPIQNKTRNTYSVQLTPHHIPAWGQPQHHVWPSSYPGLSVASQLSPNELTYLLSFNNPAFIN